MAGSFAIRSLVGPNGARMVARSLSKVTSRSLNTIPQAPVKGDEHTSLRRHHPTLFTLTTPSPAQLTKDQFFSSLQRTASEVPQPDGATKRDRTIVILTTPSFATWIEDIDFVGKIVDTLARGCDSFDHVQTASAVVDALRSPCESSDAGANSHTAEGFSFMITSGTSKAQPRDLAILQSLSAKPDPFSGLRFNFLSPSFADNGALVEYTVPLANTLFRNGRASTLLLGKWAKDLPNRFVPQSAEYKDAYTISTEEFRTKRDDYGHFPLDGLTKPRRIVAGMGNIVRQLEGDDGKPLPASTELEESVVSYLSAKKLPQQQVSVWALVIGEEELHKARTRNLWTLILENKASLHRVLSGGGGWGKKAGLLSLDPDTKAPGSETGHDFSAFQKRFAGVDEQKQALGDIAKPGSYVWFLVAHTGLVDENGKLAFQDTDARSFLGNTERETDASKQIVLGCVRSTIDDVPAITSGSHDTSTRDDSPMNMSAEFSALSEVGLFLRVRSATEHKLAEDQLPSWVDETTCKIDVPGTQFTAWYQQSASERT